MKQLSAQWILIAGLSIVFLYFGIDKFLNPLIWMAWIPNWVDGLLGFDKSVWNKIFGVIEIILVPLFIFPKTRRIGASLMGLYLLPIIWMSWPSDIAIRDIGLFSICIFFALLSQEHKK